MLEFDSTLPTLRLLAATLATHEAFTEAAHAVVEPGYAAEFAQRAEYQARIAIHLRGYQAAAGLESDALRRVPVVRLGRSPSSSADRDPRALFDRCLRLMDAATLEFCRAYGPGVARVLSSALQVAYPISTTRHGVASTGQGSHSNPGGPVRMN